jgi:hypothetical protein
MPCVLLLAATTKDVRGIPWNAVTVLAWHVAQPVVTPEWLYKPLAKLVYVVVEAAAVWHTVQLVVPNGTWFVAGALIVKLADGIAYLAALVMLWHWAQSDTVVDGPYW